MKDFSNLNLSLLLGDIPQLCVKHVQSKQSKGNVSFTVSACDINKNMLDEGKRRAKEQGLGDHISWILADASDLPFNDNSYDAYTITFGIRNMEEVDKPLLEAYRILKPGGRFLCMEFSKPVIQLLERYVTGNELHLQKAMNIKFELILRFSCLKHHASRLG